MLKQERLSPKSEAAAYTLSLELFVALLSCLASATPESSRSPFSRCAVDAKDTASDTLGQAALLMSVEASAGPTSHVPSTDMSRFPHSVLAYAPPTLSVVTLEHLRSCIVAEKHVRDLRTFSKTDALDETTAMTPRREPMA